MHTLVPYFEAVMLLCFGMSWPMAIIKTLRARSVKGVSPYFLGIIELGYLAGILFKYFGQCDWVIGLYILNLILVGIELGLYVYYSRKERVAEGTLVDRGESV